MLLNFTKAGIFVALIGRGRAAQMNGFGAMNDLGDIQEGDGLDQPTGVLHDEEDGREVGPARPDYFSWDDKTTPGMICLDKSLISSDHPDVKRRVKVSSGYYKRVCLSEEGYIPEKFESFFQGNKSNPDSHSKMHKKFNPNKDAMYMHVQPKCSPQSKVLISFDDGTVEKGKVVQGSRYNAEDGTFQVSYGGFHLNEKVANVSKHALTRVEAFHNEGNIEPYIIYKGEEKRLFLCVRDLDGDLGNRYVAEFGNRTDAGEWTCSDVRSKFKFRGRSAPELDEITQAEYEDEYLYDKTSKPDSAQNKTRRRRLAHLQAEHEDRLRLDGEYLAKIAK